MLVIIYLLGALCFYRLFEYALDGPWGTTGNVVIDVLILGFFIVGGFSSLLDEELMSIVVHLAISTGLSWFSLKLLKKDCAEGVLKGNETSMAVSGVFDSIKTHKELATCIITIFVIACLAVIIRGRKSEEPQITGIKTHYETHNIRESTNKSNIVTKSNTLSSYDYDDPDGYGYYDDFEDFFDDHYEDFDSYEDAEDYFDTYY